MTPVTYAAALVAALTVAWATYRNNPEDEAEQYPHDEEDHLSEREKKRQKELEAEKGKASGESV